MAKDDDLVTLADLKAALEQASIPDIGEIKIYDTDDIDPNEKYPGTEWQLIDGYFLRASSEGGDGGKDEITLTKENIPEHAHDLNGLGASAVSAGSHQHYAHDTDHKMGVLGYNSDVTSVGRVQVYSGGTGTAYRVYGTTNIDDLIFGGKLNGWSGTHSHTLTGKTTSTGNGKPFDNRPKYINVYVWKRVA